MFSVISVLVAAWLVYVLTRPEAELLSYLFDDAFYYLVPAHSFAHGAGWSFDGTTRTSRFQVVYARSAVAMAVCGAAVIALCARERQRGSERFGLAAGSTVAIALYIVAYAASPT